MARTPALCRPTYRRCNKVATRFRTQALNTERERGTKPLSKPLVSLFATLPANSKTPSHFHSKRGPLLAIAHSPCPISFVIAKKAIRVFLLLFSFPRFCLAPRDAKHLAPRPLSPSLSFACPFSLLLYTSRLGSPLSAQISRMPSTQGGRTTTTTKLQTLPFVRPLHANTEFLSQEEPPKARTAKARTRPPAAGGLTQTIKLVGTNAGKVGRAQKLKKN